MPLFRYVDDEPRTYNAFGALKKGAVIDHNLEQHGALDHRFEELTEDEAAEYLASLHEKE